MWITGYAEMRYQFANHRLRNTDIGGKTDVTVMNESTYVR